jgi:hypothetical protein
MAVPNTFVEGTVANPSLVNENFEYIYNHNQSMSATILENSINIIKLQYENSLQDINHDYMFVDLFSSSSGYLNSVITDGSQQTRLIYNSCGDYTISGNVGSCFCCINNGYLNIGGSTTSGAGCVTRAITACSNGCIYFNGLCLTDVSYIKYSLCRCQCARNNTQGIGINQVQMNSLIDYSWEYGNYCCCFTVSTNCYGATVSGNTIVEYCKTGGNCWNVYVNSSCICNSEFSSICELPIITINCSRAYAMTHTTWDGSASNCNFIFLTDFCYTISGGDNTNSVHCGADLVGYYTNETIGCETKIKLVPFTFSEPINSIYLKLENYGSGLIKYNIIDMSTDCYIATELDSNSIFNLPCNMYSVRLEILQKDNAVSCIKSYAILAGEA